MIAIAQALYAITQDGEQSEAWIEVAGYAHKLGGIRHHLCFATTSASPPSTKSLIISSAKG